MSDKSAAVAPITPRTPLRSQKIGSTAPRITPAEFGERLVRGREQRQRSLQEIADTTKIASHQLRSLERGDLHHLPGGIYRRAIVRQYAAAVGLNVEDTLGALATVEGEIDIDDQAFQAGADRPGDTDSSLFSTALWSSATPLVLVGAVAALAVGWYQGGTTAPAADAPVTVASAPATKADVPAIALVAGTEAVRATAGDIELGTASAALQTEPEAVNVAGADATEGELRITSEPSGAVVTVNGVGWGPTPVTIRYMPFGKKLIRVTKPGYASAQRGFEFVPDRRVQSVRIQLSAESPDAR